MADGTRVNEPPAGIDQAVIDTHEADYGSGDVRDRQRVSLAGQGATDFVETATDYTEEGQRGLVVRDPILSDILAQLQEIAAQQFQGITLDVGNSEDVDALAAQPGTPWIGEWTPTRDEGIVAVRTVVAGSPGMATKGGIFTFEFSESLDRLTTPGPLGQLGDISESRPIIDLSEVREIGLDDFGLLYRVAFEPDDDLGADLVFVTTQQYRQPAQVFARLADQKIERQNAAMGSMFTFDQRFDPVTGKSVNLPPPAISGTDPENQTIPALAASEVWEGTYLDIESHGSLIFLYAVPTSNVPTSVQLQFSDDQSTQVGISTIARQDVTSGPVTYAVYLSITNGSWAGKFVRPKITNSATPQASAGIAFFARNQFPYGGTFAGLNSALTFFSQALLVRAVPAVNTASGGFTNVLGTDLGAMFVKQEGVQVTPSGALFSQGSIPYIRHDFGIDDCQSSVDRLIDLSTGGTATPDLVNGGVVFAAPPGTSAIFLSEKFIPYTDSPGHGMMGDQTVFLEPDSDPLADGAYIRWGFCDAGGPDNGFGWEAAETGLATYLRKLGTDTLFTPQASWVVDQCLGGQYSRFRRRTSTATVSEALAFGYNGLFRSIGEFLYAVSQRFEVEAPIGGTIPVHINQFPNAHQATSLRTANLHLFIEIVNPGSGTIKARSGSWVGEQFNSKSVTIGLDPNGDFREVSAQGQHNANSTNTPLNGDTGGTDHIWRGEWFKWQDSHVAAVVSFTADVPGTFYWDVSDVEVPVNGDESSLTDTVPIPFDPVIDLFYPRVFPIQSVWARARYINDLSAQAEFNLSTAFTITAPPTPMQRMRNIPNLKNLGTMGQDINLVEDSDNLGELVRVTGTQVGTSVAMDVSVSAVDVEVAEQAPAGFVTGQGQVTSAATVALPPVPVDRRLSLCFASLDPKITAWFSESPAKLLASQGFPVFPFDKQPFDLGPGEQVHWLIEDQGGSITTSVINADTVENNSGTTLPENSFTTDDTRAILTPVTDSYELTGFTSARTEDEVGSVILQLQGRKASTPVTETVAFAEVTSGTGGNVGSVTTSTDVPLDATYQYLVAISRRNAAAAITGVTGMGTTWQPALDGISDPLDAIGNGNDTRVTLWRPVSPPTISGPVTATFSALPTNSVIAVVRLPGADLSVPFSASEVLESVTNSNSYADSIVGLDKGVALTFTAMRERTHTAGSGFTEQGVEIRTGLTTSDASLVVSALPLVAGGAQAYSGTLSGNVGWAVIAVVVQPREAVDPIVRVRYKVGVEDYSTTVLLATLTETTDMDFEVDVSTDRDWTFDDIDAIRVRVDVVSIGAAPAELDRVGIEETDIQVGNSVRLAWFEVFS